jgi:hypothetical protein
MVRVYEDADNRPKGRRKKRHGDNESLNEEKSTKKGDPRLGIHGCKR